MGFFDVFKKGLDKTRNFLQTGMTRISANLGYFDENMLDELEELLLLADFGVPSTEIIISTIKDEIKKTGDASYEAVIETLKTSISDLMGDRGNLVIEENKLNIILMVGVNGTGKTTTIGKLCHRYASQGKNILVAGADTFRAAAIEQLKTWTEKTGVDFISKEQFADPASVVYEALDKAKSKKYDILFIDTAGRLHNKKNLMEELGKIVRIIKRESSSANLLSLLVLDATTGQNATLQAKYFNEVCQLDGLVITKLDGNAKGGVAVAVCQQVKLPLYLAGLGEKAEDLLDFDKEIFINSLLPSKQD